MLSEDLLTQDDLVLALSFAQRCMTCTDADGFHAHILDFAASLNFEYVLYGYTDTFYHRRQSAHVIQLSTPQEWAAEYEQEKNLLIDPVVFEMERRIANGEHTGFIVWDAYDWPLSERQQSFNDRRRFWGMEYGCSVFRNSQKKDFAFLVSFSSRTTKPDARLAAMAMLIVPQLTVTRKRLNMQELVRSLSEKEADVAQKMMRGKTNWEISRILNISENTVKFHIKSIFSKLQVNNRQQAIAVLLAESYLSL